MSVYVIAEIGINHNGRLDICQEMVNAAAEAGCNAVKLQLFRATTLYPRTGGQLDWQNAEKAYSYDIYTAVEGFETPLEWLAPLQRQCQDRQLELLASVFDTHTLHAALAIGIPRLKLASSVITHLPLLAQCASSGLPCLLSTGGASLGEMERAVQCILTANTALPPQQALTLLHCCLQYPTPPEQCHLGILRTLSLAFPQIRVGYSDHSLHPTNAPYAAVLLGAQVVEKHITLDKKMVGPDHFFALTPPELQEMVRAIRKAEEARCLPIPPVPDALLHGSTAPGRTQKQQPLRNFVFPVLFTREAAPAGQPLKPTSLALLRPAKKERGLEAVHLPLFQKYALCPREDLPPETALQWKHFLASAGSCRKLLLRADAHKGVGTGDLASFMAFARLMQARGFECHFCTRATDDGLRLLSSYGVDAERIHCLAPHLPVKEEVLLTASVARYLEAHAVLVQVTDRPLAAYADMDVPQGTIRGCVSFEEETPQGFDLVWSWDVAVSGSYDTASQQQTRWFLGPEYVVLPPEFDALLCRARVLRHQRKRLLVVMGGGDAQDITSEVARRLTALGNPLHTTFVLGAGYAHEDTLRHSLDTAPYPFDIKKHITNMLTEYLACDVCIAAGGLTASELAFTRTPALLVAACGHQDSRCILFEKRGWAKFLGKADDWHLRLEDILHFTPQGAPFTHKMNEVADALEDMVQQKRIPRGDEGL